MPAGRRASVFDLAGRRIHADGRRVKSNKPRTRLQDPGAVQDPQGNWIARDTAGSWHGPKLRKRSRKSDAKGKAKEDGNEEDPASGEEDPPHFPAEGSSDLEEEEGVAGPSTSRKTRDNPGQKGSSTNRPPKRRKYQGFFDGDPKLPTPRPHDAPQLPSNDLLHSIHYFTSRHYAENGFLINASKIYREERRIKKIAKSKKELKLKAQVIENEDPEQIDELQSSDNESDQQQSETHTETKVDQPQPGSSRIRGPGRPKRSKQYRDMYKAFDGSALIALGIICEEFVKNMVERAAPPDIVKETHTSPPAAVTTEFIAAQEHTT